MADFQKVATFADRLQEAMYAAQKKQIDLVNETGINRSAISRYLSGEYEPKTKPVYELARVLDVSEQWLMGYDVPKTRSTVQKNNDALADIIIKMRTDEKFFSVVKTLYEHDSADDLYSLVETLAASDAAKIKGVVEMLKAFQQ